MQTHKLYKACQFWFITASLSIADAKVQPLFEYTTLLSYFFENIFNHYRESADNQQTIQPGQWILLLFSKLKAGNPYRVKFS